MSQWVQAEYRDFYDVPRMMVCSSANDTFLFMSRLDPNLDDYLDYYEVYRLPPTRDSATCASWFGIETRAIERLSDLPIHEFPFDTARRTFLSYDSIEWLLRGGNRPDQRGTV